MSKFGEFLDVYAAANLSDPFAASRVYNDMKRGRLSMHEDIPFMEGEARTIVNQRREQVQAEASRSTTPNFRFVRRK